MLPLFEEPAPLEPYVPPFALDGDERPKSHRPSPVRPGHPCCWAFWNAFRRGADGQSPPAVEHDELIAKYVADGYNIGRLFRPLPCMKERRR